MTTNPFAELSATIAPGWIQAFVVLMIILVVAGTLFDVIHKKSAQYFFENWRKQQGRGERKVGSIELVSLAIQTVCVEVATSSEFCNPKRRIAHLLTMYGFIAYALSTAVMVFGYPTPATPTPAIWWLLWYLGALSVCVGGYWFWFVIRVDVSAEGHSPLRIVRADLFILSLLESVTLALLWSIFEGTVLGWIFFVGYVIATLILFGGIPWSKFAHMFFKPAAALQKRVAEADGSRSNLPEPANKPDDFGSTRGLPQNY